MGAIAQEYKRRMVNEMPTIMPVSDLKNYTSVVNQVSYGNRVYLTKNGHGNWALIEMRELDDLDKDRALLKLIRDINMSFNASYVSGADGPTKREGCRWG